MGWGVLLGVVESTGLPESISGVLEVTSAEGISLLIVLNPNELAGLIEVYLAVSRKKDDEVIRDAITIKAIRKDVMEYCNDAVKEAYSTASPPVL